MTPFLEGGGGGGVFLSLIFDALLAGPFTKMALLVLGKGEGEPPTCCFWVLILAGQESICSQLV